MMSVLISVLATLRGLTRSRAALHLEPRAPASTAGVATEPTSTAAPSESGPVALGVAVTRVGWLANGRRNREARDRRRLASSGLPLILDMEESPTPRATARRCRCPGADSDDVGAESPVGSATHSRRTRQARDPRQSGEGRKVHGEATTSAVADVAHVCNQSRPPNRGGRFLRGADGTCRLLFVLVILAHDRPRVVHTAVTAHPTVAWTAQQFREAFPWDQ